MSDLFANYDPFVTDAAAIYHDDCMVRLAAFPDNHFDSGVMDPPYHLVSINQRYSKTSLSATGTNEARARNPAPNDGLARLARGFMGKAWDGGDVAFKVATWREILRVLKPGAYLIVFGGTRTAHRMKCAIEDAGFNIRDSIRYECDGNDKYGPLLDSLNDDQHATLMEMLHEAAGGSDLAWTFGSGMTFGNRLKPAHEPIVLARKPLAGSSVAKNAALHGTGALRVDACRIDNNPGRTYTATRMKSGASQGDGSWHQDMTFDGQSSDGRLPANVMHDGHPDHPFPPAPGQRGDAVISAHPMDRHRDRCGEPSASRRYTERGSTNFAALPGARRNDKGTAGRFFYQAKANKADRYGSHHPTVKPIDLIGYLQRLITPAGGITLDAFAGSGTSVTAALREGLRIVAIEREVEYFLDIVRRVK